MWLSLREVPTLYYVIKTKKTVEEAGVALEAAVKRHGFGVLHVHDLGATLRSKGIDFPEACKVFEVCNPQQAARVLESDMRLNMALPCRISVFSENGETKIGLISPVKMLSSLSSDPTLLKVAEEVESKTVEMINDAKQ